MVDDAGRLRVLTPSSEQHLHRPTAPWVANTQCFHAPTVVEHAFDYFGFVQNGVAGVAGWWRPSADGVQATDDRLVSPALPHSRRPEQVFGERRAAPGVDREVNSG
jgi:hypothetical protein